MPVRLPPGRDRDAWQAALLTGDDPTLSRPQRFELVRMLEVPSRPGEDRFDPFDVVRDLLARRDLWKAAVLVRGYQAVPGEEAPDRWYFVPEVVQLLGVAGDCREPDTLYLLHDRAVGGELAAFTDRWGPVEVQVAGYDDFDRLYDLSGIPETDNVFRLWWD
jgi:hypothetical protein